MRKRITKRAVDALRATERPAFLWDTDTRGFGVKALPSGRKVFVFQYRRPGQGRHGTAKRLTLGTYGDLSPTAARKLAEGAAVAVRSGEDPAAVRSAAGEEPTVGDLVERFLNEHLPAKKRRPKPVTIDGYRQILRLHVLPELGSKRVADVERRHLDALHRRMRSKPYQANRMLTVMRQAFAASEAWGWRPQNSNPAAGIGRYTEQPRAKKKFVQLTGSQMAAFLEAVDEAESDGADPFGCGALRLAFLTGWRLRSEVLRLEWSNLDLDAGRARLTATKTAEEEWRELSAEAVECLRSIPRIVGSPFVFVGKDRRSHLTTVRRLWQRVRDRAGLEGYRPHDLRHSAVSWALATGQSLEIAGRTVGHRSRQATEIYSHFAPSLLRAAADQRGQAMRDAIEKERQSK